MQQQPNTSFVQYTLKDADQSTQQRVKKALQAAGATVHDSQAAGNTFRAMMPLHLSPADQKLVEQLAAIEGVENVEAYISAGTSMAPQGGSSWSGGTPISQADDMKVSGYGSTSKLGDEVQQPSDSSWHEYQTPGTSDSTAGGDMPKRSKQTGQHEI